MAAAVRPAGGGKIRRRDRSGNPPEIGGNRQHFLKVLEARFGSRYILLSYPPAACCRLKGLSPEWPLLFSGGASENAGLRGWLQPVLWGGQGDAAQMARSGKSEQDAAPSGYTIYKLLCFAARVLGIVDPGVPAAPKSHLCVIRHTGFAAANDLADRRPHKLECLSATAGGGRV